MEIFLAIIIYLALVATSVSLMVWDWTSEGLDVNGTNFGEMILLSTFGCIWFIMWLGTKFIIQLCSPRLFASLQSKVLFKGKRNS